MRFEWHMRRAPRRLVVGIASVDSAQAAVAYEKLRFTFLGRVACVLADGTVKGFRGSVNSIRPLRLDGEAIVTVRASGQQIPTVMTILRAAGVSSVFVLPVKSEPAVPPAARSRRPILAKLQDNETTLTRACEELLESLGLNHSLSPSAEWLLDNAHLTRTQVADIRRNLPKSHPIFQLKGSSSGHDLPIFAIARSIIHDCDHAVQAAGILEALNEYQKTQTLSIAELWAVPLAIRFALLDALARFAEEVSRGQRMREAAYFWANRLIVSARRDPPGQSEALEQSVAQLVDHPMAAEASFITCLVEQLQDEESALARIQLWLHDRNGLSLPELVRMEHNREAAECVSISNAFGSLRGLSRIDFAAIFETASLVEVVLRTDPEGVYNQSDFSTQDDCRKQIESLSRSAGSGSTGKEEVEIARRAVALASVAGSPRQRQIAYFLLDAGISDLEKDLATRARLRQAIARNLRRHATFVYIGTVTLLTICFLALSIAFAWEMKVRPVGMMIALAALAAFPISELALQIVHALIISMLSPARLPKLNLENGVPSELATLVVVPMMLSSRDVVEREVQKLEVRFLANREQHLFFALFSDFTDAPASTTALDAALLECARACIERLNQQYPGGRFLLFHRPREWSESEQLWIGRERKRGKLEDLNAFLNGEGSKAILLAGRLDLPIRYVITLDADTQLPPGTARRLVETIAHPLNQVELHPVTRVRQRGFSIIQPRVSVALPDATVTRFTRVFADTTGTDPYCETVSDAQQDLFQHAIYHGKAIYDLRAFHASLHQRFPPETLLSHDLIEGAHAGVGLATDIELFENMPLDYSGFSKRQHRWIRGDWQIATWGLSRVPIADGSWVGNPLGLIDRWRVLDNLRRSLVPVASCLLLLLGWLISAAPGVWSLVLALAFGIPVAAPLLDRTARHLQGRIRGWQGAADDLVRALVMMAFLPHQAWLAMDAIVRVTFRRWVSRRLLLEWQTAEGAAKVVDKDARGRISATMRHLLIVSALSALLLLFLHARGAILPTAPFVALWIASPGVMYWLALPSSSARRNRLGREDAAYLRGVSRRTWRYFDDLVNAETNWLPPDNSQLALHIEVAQRTSPTNIGLWLASLLAVRDFGYITTDDLISRSSATLTTLLQMERYEGHLLNWYDTRTLAPLMPRYVSTVDSGNLLASLWVLNRGCQELLNEPIVGTPALRGLSDTVSILAEVCGEDPSATVQIHALQRMLRGRVEGHALIGRLRLSTVPTEQLAGSRWASPGVSKAEVSKGGDERFYWAGRLASQAASWNTTVDRYLGWMEILTYPPDTFLSAMGADIVAERRRAVDSIPSLVGLKEGVLGVETILSRRGNPSLNPEIAGWLDQLSAAYEHSRTNAAEAVRSLQDLGSGADRFANGINMRFLYDDQRHLFGLGYSVGDPLVFQSHYDLLASECRVASMVAIAKGDAPLSHWFSLGRSRVTVSGRQTLLSWSGTMFEYLMPLLFTRTFANSSLDQACHDALELQMEYGKEQGVPWGVSECAYSALDANQTYQYHAFGVPKLALQSDPKDAVVVAPYATMLALSLDPLAALDNLRQLELAGASGPMGFYEAIDYTREANRDGDRGVVIYAYMAHHQGMTLLALNNLLHHGAMERRFHGDLRVRAFESLLFERIPIDRPLLDEAQGPSVSVRVTHPEEPENGNWEDATAPPRTHLYGNGSYALMITNSGTGYSRWNALDVTRWRADSTLDPWGSFLYIRDTRADTVWAATPQPLGGQLGTSSVHFAADRAEFQRSVTGINTVLHITVASEDDTEIRRLTITNRSLRDRQLELTSYLELALAPHAMDKAHPAFAKLFIETEWLENGVLIARRRQRAPEDPQIWAAHILVGGLLGLQHETDRATFFGRGNSADTPDELRRELSGSTGAVLDPIFSLRCTVNLEPRERVELSFITIAAHSREELVTLIAKYRRLDSIARAFEMAWTRSQLEFRHLGIGPAGARRFQELANPLLYPDAAFRASADRLLRNQFGQAALWIYGVSGDLPIVCVTAADVRSLPLIREVLMAHSYWRVRGLQADLIILNQESPSYDHPFTQQLRRQIEAHAGQTGSDRPGGVFLRDWHSIPEDHRTLILSSASVVLSGNRGSLQQQLVRIAERPGPRPFVPTAAPGKRDSPPLPFLELPYFNGIGGFTGDAREYATYLKHGQSTPTPWINVIANSGFGTVVGESGLGFTWCGNSQAHRLTPWNNDPVSDTQSEAIYIRDDETGEYWTPTPLPRRDTEAYRARHGQGYSVFEHNSNAIEQELTVFVPVADAVKICRLQLWNHSPHPRRLSVTYFAEWVLGSQPEDQQRHIQTSWDKESGSVFARQTWTGANRVAFVASNPVATSYSGDRGQFFGRRGSRARPAALLATRLDNRTGAALDPGAALQCSIAIEPGGSAEVVFVLGEASTVEEVRSLVGRYRTPEEVSKSLAQVHHFWDTLLGTLQVRTPLLSTDFLLNRWLVYQALSCRFWARTAFYQSSGAFGFRDQLQDSLALLYAAPRLTREHILRCASRQFAEGDVQHWWHADTGAGVRTRCSDDLLWLPYAVAHYTSITGDAAILMEEVPFLDGPVLSAGEQDRLFTPTVSAETAPLWEHCRRAIETGWRLGSHNLPLIGSSDWNDGLSRVGIEGKGESAWLAWFLCSILRDFASLIENLPPGPALATIWNERAAALATAMETNCWDGDWYLRGFFDSGAPLGSHLSSEASIDSLPQSWAAISGAADPVRTLHAVDSAERLLVDEQNKIVRLFTPPFDHSQPHPGYIMGYPPGVRENGGQYTHGSLWLAMARARLGDGDAAVRLLQVMNPVERNRTPGDLDRYRGEPYVVAADVSAAPNFAGRSGWTWYTGAAGWMYRIWIEEVLGFHLRGNLLTMNPVIPQAWPGFELWYRYGSTHYEIRVVNHSAVPSVDLDGNAIPGGEIRLVDDGGSHIVTVKILSPPGKLVNEEPAR